MRNMVNWELSGELFEVCDVALESQDDIPVEQLELQGSFGPALVDLWPGP